MILRLFKLASGYLPHPTVDSFFKGIDNPTKGFYEEHISSFYTLSRMFGDNAGNVAIMGQIICEAFTSFGFIDHATGGAVIRTCLDIMGPEHSVEQNKIGMEYLISE